MYPDLSYILADIFGSHVDNFFAIFKTFGMFLALAFAVSAYVLKSELQRKEKEGLINYSIQETKIPAGISWISVISNTIFGFVLGFKIPFLRANFEAFKLDPASILLSGKGMMVPGLVMAAIFAVWAYYKSNKEKIDEERIIKEKIYPSQRVMDITFIAAISGIIGAKVFVVFESKEAFMTFLQDPINQLISGSGLTVYGGLIMGFLALWYYVRKIGMKPIHLFDALAPAFLMGYAIGRMGCQFAGDGDWGIINNLPPPSWWIFPDWAWAFDFPNTVLKNYHQFGNSLVDIPDCSGFTSADGIPEYCKKLKYPVYPTSVYETIVGFIMFAILWAYRRKFKVAGTMFFTYLMLNGLERFFIEKIRVNDKIQFLGMQLTQAEIISAVLVLIGLIGLILVLKNKDKPNNGLKESVA